jgi:SH3 domain-containing YSC84-like protein 1
MNLKRFHLKLFEWERKYQSDLAAFQGEASRVAPRSELRKNCSIDGAIQHIGSHGALCGRRIGDLKMRKTFVAVLAIAGSFSTAAFAADREIKVDDRLNASADTLTDMMRAADKGIPQDLIDKAHCVVVVPGMKKAGFIFGAKYGRGFAACRRSGGSGWSAPAAMRVEGGSVGFQIGASETDVVLLVMNDGGMKRLLSDKFTIGGEATAAAGPVGRDASAQTDAMMRAEMLSYSRSRGLFAGISLEGATLRPDEETNRELYGRAATNREILTSDFKTPAVAEKFKHSLNRESAERSR